MGNWASRKEEPHPVNDTIVEEEDGGNWPDSDTNSSEVESLDDLQLEEGYASPDEELEENDSPTCGPHQVQENTTKLNVTYDDIIKEALIGEGEFGKVYKATLRESNQTVAVKVFNADFNYKTTIAELSKLTGLRHRNIVGILGVVGSANSSESPKVSVLVRYFEEGSMIQYFANPEKPNDYTTLVKLALDVIEGCDYLHSRSILHGNLAARNIFIEKQHGRNGAVHYNAKVSDFTVVRLAPATISGKCYMRTHGGLLLDIRWAPKELLEEDAKGFTKMSDVWSFGVVLWEILTKGLLLPYGKRKEDVQVKDDILRGLSPLDILAPEGYPPDIITVLRRIFQVDPASRPTFCVLKEKFTRMVKELVGPPDSSEESKSYGTRDWKVVRRHEVYHGSGAYNPKRGMPKRYSKPGEGPHRPVRPMMHRRCPPKPKPQPLIDYKDRGRPQQLPRSIDADNSGGQSNATDSMRHIVEFQALGPSTTAGSYGAPPPYTPRPLPNHSAYFGTGREYGLRDRRDYNREIRRKEKELEQLKVEKLKNEVTVNLNKLQDVVTQLTNFNYRSVDVGNRSRNGRTFSAPRGQGRPHYERFAPSGNVPLIPESVTNAIMQNFK